MSLVYDLVVVAGGSGSRLGGAVKADLTLGGERLLDRTLAATQDARTRVLVGQGIEVPDDVVVTNGTTDGLRHPDDRRPMRAVPFGADADLTHTAFVGEQTRAFIERQGDDPWLCVAGFYSPHEPWIVPQRYLDRYDPAALTLPDQEVVAARDPGGHYGRASSPEEPRRSV